MFNIIICEDEEIIRKKLQIYLEKISLKHDLNIHTVLSTSNPYEVLEYSLNKPADILLLDIDLKLPDIDGIKLGNKLREINKNIIIIFLSSRLERIFESFTCIPFDFIAKPSIVPHLEETILRICDNKQHVPHGNFIKIKNTIINLDEIIFIEKQIKKSIFYTSAGIIEISINFIELKNCLSDNFLQINKSFIINKKYVIDINISTKLILLKNKKTLKYSTKYIDNLGGILI